MTASGVRWHRPAARRLRAGRRRHWARLLWHWAPSRRDWLGRLRHWAPFLRDWAALLWHWPGLLPE